MYCPEGRTDAHWVEIRQIELRMNTVWAVIGGWCFTWNNRIDALVGSLIRDVLAITEAMRIRMEHSISKLAVHRRRAIADWFFKEEERLGTEAPATALCAFRTLQARMLGSNSLILVQ